MNIDEKINQLRAIVNDRLAPLIGSKYAYLELPYYPNIGDNFIWDGTETFLKQFKLTCVYKAAIETFYYHDLPNDCTIILQGGGNFGDLWSRHHIFRKKIIELYPNNPIVIFPQSVCYEKEENIAQDEEFFALHPLVVICARDKVSFDFMTQHFPHNKVLLVPDMAFFVNVNNYISKRDVSTNRILYAKRDDKEFRMNLNQTLIPKNAEIHDWPCMEKTFVKERIVGYFEGCLYYLSKVNGLNGLNAVRDWVRKMFFRPWYMRQGVKFLEKYDVVYSTRLHIMVVAAMLGKKVFLIDNSYGKNFNLYNTWLKDVDNIELL